MKSEACPICENQERTSAFPQLCSNCGWEFELFPRSESAAHASAQEQLATRQAYWKLSGALNVNTQDEDHQLEQLDEQIKTYAKEIAELEEEAKELDDVLELFKNQNGPDFMDLKRELRQFKSRFDKSLSEIEKDLAKQEEQNNTEVICTWEDNKILVRTKSLPKVELRILLGLATKQKIQAIQDADILMNLVLERKDFKMDGSWFQGVKELDLPLRGNYSIRFLKYQKSKEENLSIITTTESIKC